MKRFVIRSLSALVLAAFFAGAAFAQTDNTARTSTVTVDPRLPGYVPDPNDAALIDAQEIPHAPAADPAPPVALPREIVLLAGATFNRAGSPKLTLDVGAAYQVAGKNYVCLMIDLAFQKNQTPGMTFRPEFAREVFRVNGLPILLLAGIGAEFKASDPAAVIRQLAPIVKAGLENVGTNLGYNAATGVATNFHVAGPLYLAPSFRVVKGSLGETQYVAGIQFASKVRISPSK